VNAVAVRLLDADMAPAAGLRNVVPVNGRTRIGGRPDVVNAVTIVARRGDDQSIDDQSTAVHAIDVLLGGVRLADVGLFHHPGVRVTVGAGKRELEFEGARLWIAGAQDVMGAVTVTALGGGAVTADAGLTVDAAIVLRLLLGVALAALGRRGTDCVRQRVAIGVAGRTRDLSMHRVLIDLVRHVERRSVRSGLSSRQRAHHQGALCRRLLSHRFISMTLQTASILRGRLRNRGGYRHCQGYHWQHPHPSYVHQVLRSGLSKGAFKGVSIVLHRRLAVTFSLIELTEVIMNTDGVRVHRQSLF
jgi:hypothetical protein